jgi:polysaccharide biosynthesis protein PslH
MTGTVSAPQQNQAPRVLVLDEEIPWPANTGKRLRTLNLLTELAKQFSVELLVHANNASTEAVDELRRRSIEVHVASSSVPDKGGLLFLPRIVASLAAGLPYSVYSHYQTGFRKSIDALLRERQFQLIHCEWTPYALYALSLQSAVTIAAHNVEWLIWDRMTKVDSRRLHRLLYRAQATLMRRFERRMFQRFDHATAVSREDGRAITALGCRDVAVVPNGVDADYFKPQPGMATEPYSIVFTGSMDWLANQDAISWFIREIHPLLKKRIDYRLYVVGRKPPPWMVTPGGVPAEVVVTGTVDDVRPWITKASVYVVPLRVGGGSRLKILEALAMAKPVVSTSVGMEGLDLEPGVQLVVADKPELFVSAICELLESPRRSAALGNAGRARIEDCYTWKQIAPVQAALWRRAMGIQA